MSNWPLLRTTAFAQSVTFTNADGTRASPPLPGAVNTRGAWGQLTAATPYAADGMMMTVNCTNNESRRYLFSLGIGPVGAEVPIAEDIFVDLTTGFRGGHGRFWIPVRVPAGVRLACAYQANDVTYGNVGEWPNFSLWLMPANPLAPVGFAGYDTINVNRATTNLGGILLSGAYGGGAIVEVVGSTSREYRAVMLGNGRQVDGVVDLYVGAAGAEVPLVEKQLGQASFDGVTLGGQMHHPVPVRIPAGSRLSMRQWGGSVNQPVLLHLFY